MNRAKRRTCWLFAGTMLRTPRWHPFKKLRDFHNSRGCFKVFSLSRRSSLVAVFLILPRLWEATENGFMILVELGFPWHAVSLLKWHRKMQRLYVTIPLKGMPLFHTVGVNTWGYVLSSSTSISVPGFSPLHFQLAGTGNDHSLQTALESCCQEG